MPKPLKPIKVLIVDDSPFIRMSLKKILSGDPEIQVVDTARDGREGIAKILELKPDVVTMDVEMPVMDGIQALEEIMRRQPTPVIVLSAVTTSGARQTIKAFELGAVEVVAKPSGQPGDDLATLARELIFKVKNVAGINPALFKRRTAVSQTAAARESDRAIVYPRFRVEIVAIGVSTGGPTALQVVLSQIPKDFPVPLIVAQHMPAGFTASLAARLNTLCQVTVKEVEDGEELRPGTVYIGQAGKQFQIKRGRYGLTACIGTDSPVTTLYKPSVDVMFLSLAAEVGGGVLGVVMTGMGNDGLRGMKALKERGAYGLAESEKTCVIYGMPRSVIEAGLIDRIEPLPGIARAIVESVKRR